MRDDAPSATPCTATRTGTACGAPRAQVECLETRKPRAGKRRERGTVELDLRRSTAVKREELYDGCARGETLLCTLHVVCCVCSRDHATDAAVGESRSGAARARMLPSALSCSLHSAKDYERVRRHLRIDFG